MTDASAVSPSTGHKLVLSCTTADVVMTDATAASPSKHMDIQLADHQSALAPYIGSASNAAGDRLNKESQVKLRKPPEPYLSLKVQWRLCHANQTKLGQAQAPQTQQSQAQLPQPQLNQAQVPQTQLSQAAAHQSDPVGAFVPLSRAVTGAKNKPVGALSEPTGVAVGPAVAVADPDGNNAMPRMRCCVHAEPALPAEVLECFQEMLGKCSSFHCKDNLMARDLPCMRLATRETVRVQAQQPLA